MYMTVEQALTVYPLSEGKLIAGSTGRNRVIKSVNVMDAPDITDWIKEGEMLLTTAYLLKDRPEEAYSLLQKLNQCGSSALGIKLGRFWTSVPEALIEQANDLGFPLIELPYEFTFSDQMNGLFRAEMKRNTGVLTDVLNKQIQLMRFALKSNPIQQLFDSIADVVGIPIAVIGSRGQVVYNCSLVSDDGIVGDWPGVPHNGWITCGHSQALSIPLMRQTQCTGFVLFFQSQLLVSPIEEGLCFQAAELIAYHMNFKYEDYFELSIQKDFGLLIKRYLQNGLPAETIQDYAKRWEIDLFRPWYRCVLTDLEGKWHPDLKLEKLELLKSEYLCNSRLQQLKGMHIVMNEGLLSVFPSDFEDGDESIVGALNGCFAALESAGGLKMTATISSAKKKAEQLAEAYSECREAHRLSADWGGGERILRYDMMDLALIFEHVKRERMETYCNRWLGGLLNKDPEYAGEMLRTLEAYLENDCQLNETAKKLFIHRNTATYRIEKLSELLDVDLKRMNDLMRLKIAFLFRRMLSQSYEADRIR